ncbi:LytR/AlgR family response regulator transcription factor [Larkinella rosea]|uniref:DNA-binding response regulator n=1 Tax=Larkinella rosea TaxID=2025312 RepID=A0A3P1C3F7_9BACT|nr:LytTR family DNA-binding domain-containing protein [Larkinella rosea]RRB07354.1 DNA-binding response regulator [Larkinella rosea]
MTILIIEDEPRLARILQELVQSVRPEAHVLGICSSIEETVHFFRTSTQTPDVLFMDVKLADGNSFEVFKQVSITAPVIFCTAYDDFMLDAFKTNGIDYILKPVTEADIQAAFTKLDTITKALLPNLTSTSQRLSNPPTVTRYNTSFLVRLREKLVPVSVNDIGVISFENDMVCLYTTKNEQFRLFKTMDEVEAVLDPAVFFRINRQMIVSRPAIVAIEPYFNRKIVLTLLCKPAEKPVVSRLKVSAFLNWMEK